MADTKITNLTAVTALATGDLFVVVDDPGGTPATKKITIDNVMASMVGLEMGDQNTWTPTFTGFSADPTGGIYRYSKVGKVCTLFVYMPNTGTSNNAAFTMTLPFTAATATGMYWTNLVSQVKDNGSVVAAPASVMIASAGTVLNVYKDTAAGGFTTSNGKSANFEITYETA